MYKVKKCYRLPHFDYSSPGYYFITICVKDRRKLLGTVINGQMNLSEIGKIAKMFWAEIPERFPNIRLDQWVIMPNHMHGILVIDVGDEKIKVEEEGRKAGNEGRNADNEGRKAGNEGRNADNEGRKADNEGRNAPWRVRTETGELRSELGSGLRPLDKNSISSVVNHFKGNVKRYCNKNGMDQFEWQSRFHDRIIRDERALDTIRRYIWENPKRWEKDRLGRLGGVGRLGRRRNAPRRVPTK